MPHTVQCIKLGHEAEGLPKPPFGLAPALAQRIYENVSKQAWQEWLAHQTRLINEYRLSLAEASARKFLTDELEKYFFGGELATTHYVPPPPKP